MIVSRSTSILSMHANAISCGGVDGEYQSPSALAQLYTGHAFPCLADHVHNGPPSPHPKGGVWHPLCA
ncbi:hypothetical protein BD309DRAFT_992067 [Dichomitus squalens]|uniref:Uncharacterized protein n=1 Tax=Dichomitus squalens TaxID=114155 RepID=A0A4Q9NMQ0_9APHY|nr:hypothetical protein BD309DRAFT_992067 [Dichomitus squalens]TBU53945.1 hypothetical protein BD310DRAFT_951760 [Dichomitus squalens]